MSDTPTFQERIWECKIGGPVLSDAVPSGADLPMRRAIRHAFKDITGSDAEFIFSGWGGSLTEAERAAHENREPSEEYYHKWLKEQHAEELYAALSNMVEDGDQADRMQALAVLAKARGETP